MKNEVLAYGEIHHGNHNEEIKKILESENLSNLKGLFIELSRDYQESVNKYLETGEFDNLLEKYIKGAFREGNFIENTFRIVLDFVKKNELKIVCIDSHKRNERNTRKSEIGNWYLIGNSREEDMFNYIKDYLQKNPGRYLLFSGMNHLKEGVHFRSGDKTLGSRLKELLSDGYFVINGQEN